MWVLIRVDVISTTKEFYRMNEKNLPTHRLYLVAEGDEEKGGDFWKEIGALWPHNDGKGYGLRLNGRLVIRENKTDGEADTSNAD